MTLGLLPTMIQEKPAFLQVLICFFLFFCAAVSQVRLWQTRSAPALGKGIVQRVPFSSLRREQTQDAAKAFWMRRVERS